MMKRILPSFLPFPPKVLIKLEFFLNLYFLYISKCVSSISDLVFDVS